MAKIKNTGGQPRGFFTEDGGQVVVNPGEEKEFNMSEADFKHLQQTLENTDDPKPFELSGSHGGAEKKKEKKAEGDEMPAQSTEPPAASTVSPPQGGVTPQADQQKAEQQKRTAQTKKEEETTHRK